MKLLEDTRTKNKKEIEERIRKSIEIIKKE